MDVYEWVQSSAYSSIPPNAIVGGNDLDASVIYVGRAYHNGDRLVAKVVPSKHIAFVTHQGKEIPKEHFEVLCGSNLVWEHCYHHIVPENAVLCGETSLGQPIYIGRGHYNGCLTVGKISSVHRALFIPYAGGEKRLESYEILVEQKGPEPGWALKKPLEERKIENELDTKPFPPPPPYPEPYESPPPYTKFPGCMPLPGMVATGQTTEMVPETKLIFANIYQPQPPSDVKPAFLPTYTPPKPCDANPVYVPPYIPPKPYDINQAFVPPYIPPKPYDINQAFVPSYIPPTPSSTPAENYIPPTQSYTPAESYIPSSQSYTPAEFYVPAAAIRGDLWVNANESYIPSNALHGGHDVHLTPLYICRAYHDGHMLPGKASPSHRCAYVCCNGQEIRKHNFDVLVGERYQWVSSYGGSVPPGAVEGGRDASGEVLYVGRAQHHGTLTPGKIQRSHGCIYIPFGGREIRLPNYEVLLRSEYFF